ncbi:MAG: hypothetical protein EPGJADBJ_05531 [Saprospiraceae bacterium]|nr:hypothetical protein [Saprospiraceae bacterium]
MPNLSLYSSQIGMQNILLYFSCAVTTPRRAKAALALLEIDALPAPTVLEANRKTVYKIYLTLVAQGVRRLTPVQFASISAIAEQCPLEGGVGVFLARALYQFNDRKHFDDSWLCGSTQPREEVFKPTLLQGGIGVKLAPNPATGVVNVLFEGLPIGQETDIKLVNVTGQQVLMSLGINDEVVQLDVSHLPDGLYFCIVNISGQPQQTAKLSIQH